ncbi:MAG: peptidylprolyl isomerase [Candidatus Scalindua sp.]
MYKKIVVPVMLLLFILQISNLLFANENTEAKTEVKTEATAEKETKAKSDTAAVAETEAKATEAEKEVKTQESTVAVAETEVKSEEDTEAVAETENDVIATVNGEEIFRKDFDKRMNVIRRMNQDVTRSVQIQVVNQLAKKVLLKQFVEGQNIDVSDEEVQGELEKIQYFLKSNPNNSEKSLEEILETQGSNIDELKGEVRRTLALSKYLDESVDDDEKRSYFEANKSAFNGEKVKTSHILIDTTKLKTDAELEKARQKIEEVKKEIDNGADFAEMARKYSTCPSAENGGDIGFFQRKGSIVEEFAVVAFSMEVGEISEPVKTQFGYHIIKVTDKEEGRDVSYEDVADMVDFVYMQIKTETILKGLYEKAEIEITL